MSDIQLLPWEETGDTLSIVRPGFGQVAIGDILTVSEFDPLTPVPPNYRVVSRKNVSLKFNPDKGIYLVPGTPLWYYHRDLEELGLTLLGTYVWMVLFPCEEPYRNIDLIRLDPLSETEPLLYQIKEFNQTPPKSCKST